MATVRVIEPLAVENTEGVKDWLDRLDQAISIAMLQHRTLNEENTARMKVAFLLANIGQAGYKVIRAYCAPDQPSTKSYEDLVKLLKDNLAPAPSMLSEGYAFSNMKQEAGETLSMFMARLMDKANNCGFGEFYDRMVKDRFIYGLKNERIRSHLLGKAEITNAANALEQAISKENAYAANQSMSAAVHQVSKFHSKKKRFVNQSYSDNRQNDSANSSKQLICTRCTLKGHVAKNCKIKCRNCQKVGHIRANCYKLKNAHQVTDKDADSDPVDSNVLGDQCVFLNYVNVCSTDTPTLLNVPTETVISNVEKSAAGVVSHERELLFPDSPSNESHKGNPESDPVLPSSDETEVEDVELTNLNVSQIELSCDSMNQNVNGLSIQNFDTSNLNCKPMICLTLNGKIAKFELDTGAAVSCISRVNYERLSLGGLNLVECNKTLSVANGQVVQVKFKAMVSVCYNRTSYGELGLYIVESSFPTLLGREWIEILFGSDWLDRLIDKDSLHSVSDSRQAFIEEMKQSPIFRSEVGEVRGYEAKLNLKPEARPKFCKARVTAFAIKSKVEDALKSLIDEGLLERVDDSAWASPIVPVVKPDGSIRICGDYKVTLNPALDTKVYPLPTIEECLKEMTGGQLFTKIDIKAAYNSLRLRESDQCLTTLNTPLGLLKWTRLPFGINSAGAQFQCTIDEVLLGVNQTCCRVDDILITGRNDEEHMANVREVVERLEKANFRCRLDKSCFMASSVVYLGHEVSAAGIKPVRSKVETLIKVDYPENREKLITFLGAVQYYARYLPNLATVIEPLNRLRSAKVEWVFGKREKESFDELKRMLMSDRILTFYDPDLPLKIDCDASSVGLGGVLSHVFPDGSEKPIEFVSRTLTDTERRYSQLDREALAIIWGLKRFHKYVYARPFHLVTDNEPLHHIFQPHKGVPDMVVSRLQRWSLILSCYNYTISYRPTHKHANADACSRFPLPDTGDEEITCEMYECDSGSESEMSVYSTYIGDDKPLLNSVLIAKMSRTDPVISKVMLLVQEGGLGKKSVVRKTSGERPATVQNKIESGESSENQKVVMNETKGQRPIVVQNKTKSGESSESDSFAPYVSRRLELSVDSGCLLWGSRVVIPEKMRNDVLILLHCTHMGSSSMKNMARRYIWWPGLDGDIESMVKHCSSCQVSQPYPKSSLPHPWSVPENPWDRIHVDFAGPFAGSMWLIVVDAYSKWLEVENMRQNTTAFNLIKKMRDMFARFGLPRVLVSDNGPQLSRSHEFKKFLEKNGVKYIPIPAYHPASNGQAEVMVGKFKQAMKKMSANCNDIDHSLASWLFQYRNTPHSTTGYEPSVLMFGRRVRTNLSLLNPLSNSTKYETKVEDMQIEAEKKKVRTFSVGDPVYFKDVHHDRWVRGTVKKIEGSKVLQIESEDNVIMRKHIDHVVWRPVAEKDVTEKDVSEKELRESVFDRCVPKNPSVEHDHNASHSRNLTSSSGLDHNACLRERLGKTSSTVSPEVVVEPSTVTSTNRPKRTVKVPDRLRYDKLGG